jgi:hypothetical protein
MLSADFFHRRRRPLLAVLVLGHALSWGWWMERCGFFTRPTVEDAAVHRLRALQIMEAARADGVPGFVRGVAEHVGPQPPVLAASAALVGLVRGELDPFGVWLVTGGFGMLLGLGAYRLARRFGGGGFALAVAALTLSAPVVVAMQRPLYPQLPSVAVLVWAWDLLLRTDGFRRPWISLACGCVAGAAVLTKVLVAASIGAPALVAFLWGLKSAAGERRRVLGCGVLAAFGAVLVAGPWYLEHWPEVAAYAARVTGEEGQALYSGGVGLWTIERWTYFAVALANNGFTLPIAILVAAGLVRELLVLRRRRGSVIGSHGLASSSSSDAPADFADRASRLTPGWVLVAAPLVDYPLLTVGQTSAYSVYVTSFVPLGAILAVRFATTRATSRGRLAAGAWLAAGALWCLFLVNRPFESDALPKGEIGPFQLVPRVDYNFAQFAAMAGGVSRREGERWPVEEYVELMLSRSPRARPRVTAVPSDTGGHLYLFRQNFEYAAQARGRSLEWISLTPFFRRADVAGAADLTAEADFAVVDEAKAPLEVVVGLLVARGVVVETLDRRTVTPSSTVALLQIRRPGERPALVPPSVLDEPGVVRALSRFENGWTMLGYERVVQPGGRFVLNTFWSLDPPGTDGFDFESNVLIDGKWSVKTIQPAPAGEVAQDDSGGERPLAVFSARGPRGVAPEQITQVVAVRTRGSKGSDGFAMPLQSPLPRFGKWLKIDAEGPTTRPAPVTTTRPTADPATRPPARPARPKPSDSRGTSRAAGAREEKSLRSESLPASRTGRRP